jgi:hypothetical protein
VDNSFGHTRNRQTLFSSTIVEQGKVAVLNDQLLSVSKGHSRVEVLLFIILELHLLLVLFIKRKASRPCDLIVLIEKSSFQKSRVPDCSASHLDVEASI